MKEHYLFVIVDLSQKSKTSASHIYFETTKGCSMSLVSMKSMHFVVNMEVNESILPNTAQVIHFNLFLLRDKTQTHRNSMLEIRTYLLMILFPTRMCIKRMHHFTHCIFKCLEHVVSAQSLLAY